LPWKNRFFKKLAPWQRNAALGGVKAIERVTVAGTPTRIP
jgi:hypothetical protein